MLMSYTGKKISQITEKTTVAFISVTSCIHQFFFLSGYASGDVRMLTLFDLRQPASYFQGSAYPGCLFPLLIQSLCTQQSGLSTTGRGRIPPGIRAIIFPQAASDAQMGVVCLRRMGAAVWKMTQHQDPSLYSLSSLRKTSMLRCHHPTLPSPLPEARVCGYKLIFVFWPFKRIFQLQKSISGREQPYYFSLLVVICVLLELWCSRLGILAQGLDSILLLGIQLAT